MGLETFENNSDLKKNSEVNNLLPIMTSQSERMENLIEIYYLYLKLNYRNT